jgi:hypothetical protein
MCLRAELDMAIKSKKAIRNFILALFNDVTSPTALKVMRKLSCKFYVKILHGCLYW